MEIRIHKLKILSEHFGPVCDGRKTCEIRTFDREYQVGDYLWLNWWDKEKQIFLGPNIIKKITWMNIIPGTHYVVLSMADVPDDSLPENLEKFVIEPI